jgi:hypothetical protein
MTDERHTFVITLEEDVAEFLGVKRKSASEVNAYINQVLHAAEQRQKQSKKTGGISGAQKAGQSRGRNSAETDWMI